MRDKKMRKIVIIINGNGGVGKDTLCDFANECYKVKSISSITPIKEMARLGGWMGEKDPKSRKFLADLKKVFVEYNDRPYQYLIEQYKIFLGDDSQILFAHIREGNEIDKFRQYVDIPCATLLIRRKLPLKNWGNDSDDNVENYEYDYVYDNDKTLVEAKKDFQIFLNKVVFDIIERDVPRTDENSYNLFSQNRLAGTVCDWYMQSQELLQKRV